MLNRYIDSRHLCLALDVKRKAYSLLPLNMILAVGSL